MVHMRASPVTMEHRLAFAIADRDSAIAGRDSALAVRDFALAVCTAAVAVCIRTAAAAAREPLLPPSASSPSGWIAAMTRSSPPRDDQSRSAGSSPLREAPGLLPRRREMPFPSRQFRARCKDLC